jgi:hypothetical protein
VLTAGICTMTSLTLLPSCSSSDQSESQKPCTACFAAQYADCSGMPRYASAEPTCTIVPRSRGRMRRNAASVPHT